MSEIDRRAFLSRAALATASASLAATPARSSPAPAPAASAARIKKGFMLGVTEGPILPHFELLKSAGFDGVELISPNKLDRDEVLRARDKTGLVIHGVSGSVHWGAPLSDPDSSVVERGLDAVRKEFDDVKAYGGTTVLLVPAVVNKKVNHEQAWARSQEHIKKLLPDAEKHGIKIAIEEVWNKFILTPPEMAHYVDAFQSPWVGAYFDVGNIVEYGYPEQWIRTLGSRILKIHIKEYAKPKRFDYALGEGGEIDWKEVRKALDDIRYEGWVTAEVGYGDLTAMKDVVKRMDKVLDLA